MSQAQAQLAQIIAEKNNIQQELKIIELRSAHHREQVQAADETLPTLLSQKSLAVTEENYKEAGKIHIQIQNKTEQRKKSLTELEQSGQQRMALEGQNNEATEKEKQLEKELHDYQSKIDYARFCLLQDQKISLDATLSQAKESTDGALIIKVTTEVEKSVLTQELKECVEEMAALSKQYGWNDEYQDHMSMTRRKSYDTAETRQEEDQEQETRQEDREQEKKQDLEQEIKKKEEEKSEIIEMKQDNTSNTITPKQLPEKETISLEELTTQLNDQRDQLTNISARMNMALETDDYETAGQLKIQKQAIIDKITALEAKLDQYPKTSATTSTQALNGSAEECTSDTNEQTEEKQVQEEDTAQSSSQNEPIDHATEEENIFAGITVSATEHGEMEDID